MARTVPNQELRKIFCPTMDESFQEDFVKKCFPFNYIFTFLSDSMIEKYSDLMVHEITHLADFSGKTASPYQTLEERNKALVQLQDDAKKIFPSLVAQEKEGAQYKSQLKLFLNDPSTKIIMNDLLNDLLHLSNSLSREEAEKKALEQASQLFENQYFGRESRRLKEKWKGLFNMPKATCSMTVGFKIWRISGPLPDGGWKMSRTFIRMILPAGRR